MLEHFLQFPQGGMNRLPEKTGGLLNSDHEQVYLFYFVDSLEKTTKYNLGGNSGSNCGTCARSGHRARRGYENTEIFGLYNL